VSTAVELVLHLAYDGTADNIDRITVLSNTTERLGYSHHQGETPVAPSAVQFRRLDEVIALRLYEYRILSGRTALNGRERPPGVERSPWVRQASGASGDIGLCCALV
jgi:hypothetical protein